MAVCILHNFNRTKSDVSWPQFERSLLRSCGNHLERSEKMRRERTAKAMKIKIIDSHIKGYHIFHIRPHFEIPMNRRIRSRRVHITQLSYISLNWGIPHFRVFPDCHWPRATGFKVWEVNDTRTYTVCANYQVFRFATVLRMPTSWLGIASECILYRINKGLVNRSQVFHQNDAAGWLAGEWERTHATHINKFSLFLSF